MRMQRKQFRIGELAEHLAVEKFVIRFWEKEFKLRFHRSQGGQRFYEQKDLNTFKEIKELLYNQGFTIAGAKKKLGIKPEPTIIASKKTTFNTSQQNNNIVSQLRELQEQLMKLRELL